MDSRIIYFIVSVLDEHTVTPWIVPRVHSSSRLAVLAQLRLGLELAASVASPAAGGNECPVTQHQTTERGRIKRSRQLRRTPANTTADLPDVSRARINSDKLPRDVLDPEGLRIRPTRRRAELEKSDDVTKKTRGMRGVGRE